VREAAVIGVPDEYRGGTVKAFVSLRPGETASEADLISFCKELMAALWVYRARYFNTISAPPPNGAWAYTTHSVRTTSESSALNRSDLSSVSAHKT